MLIAVKLTRMIMARKIDLTKENHIRGLIEFVKSDGAVVVANSRETIARLLNVSVDKIKMVEDLDDD